MSRRRSTRRHVLIVVANLPVPLDRRVWLECQALVERGYRVSVICPKGGPHSASFEELAGVRIHRYRPAPAASGLLGYAWEFAYSWARSAWLAMRVHRADPVAAMQACNPPDTFWLLGRMLEALGARFVFDQHDLCPEVYESRFGSHSGLLLRVLRLLEAASYRSADHVIVTNESYRDVALARGRCRPEDVTVVRSGPRATELRRGEPRAELRHGRRHLLCYLGVMGPQDGVDRAVRAVDVLVHEMGRTDVHAAFLGFGDCRAELEDLSDQLGLADWVSFPGRADDTMIRDYLSTAVIGLGPDPKNPLNDVSTMNKTLEYMAFELPVVSFDLHETRRSAGEASLYVDGDDPRAFARAIATLLDDPDRRRVMGEIGRDRIEQSLSWDHQAPRYVAVYDQLLGGPLAVDEGDAA